MRAFGVGLELRLIQAPAAIGQRPPRISMTEFYMLDREWQLDYYFRCFYNSHVLIDTPKYVRDTNGRTSPINYLDSEGGLEISRTVPEERYYF